MKKWIKYIGCLIVVIFTSIYFLFPEIRENIKNIFQMLLNSNTEALKEYIISFGIIGPIVSIAIMILQAVVAPLPAFIVTFANAYIYGWKIGTIISCIGTYLGASLCFFLSRIYGRPVAEKFVPSKFLDKSDIMFTRYGKYIVYASRLLPFVSFDGVSYAAGLTTMSFKFFSIATIIGQIPLTILVSLLGENIDKPQIFMSQAIIYGVLTFISMIFIYLVYRKKYGGKSIKILIKKYFQKNINKYKRRYFK